MSANHRRVLSVRMHLLEDYCLQLLELFRSAESGGAPDLPLPPEKAEKVERALLAFRSKIDRIKSELALDPIQQNPGREAAALMATMRIKVEELQPRYLNGYGALSDPLARYLQGCRKDLDEALESVNQILADGRREVPAQDGE